jgi:hypothetical protein
MCKNKPVRRTGWQVAGGLQFHDAQRLFLPGALLVAIQAQLLAPFVFVDFGLAAFFQ